MVFAGGIEIIRPGHYKMFARMSCDKSASGGAGVSQYGRMPFSHYPCSVSLAIWLQRDGFEKCHARHAALARLAGQAGWKVAPVLRGGRVGLACFF